MFGTDECVKSPSEEEQNTAFKMVRGEKERKAESKDGRRRKEGIIE